ncbi:MAG: hypothetical protein EAZ44_02010 [Cytophagia bacterium]|nr:MAG: hypothetical protein EAZ44_02010 [Cytophagia bacterium]
MLTKLAIFNSEKYAKVIIKLDDVSSVQALGSNGVGKTSLIGILNFLYIVGSDMIFPTGKEGNFYDYKKSVHYYFPTPNQSFIVFECLKNKANGYFCILVKRKNTEDDVEYFKIDKPFNENDYIDTASGLKKFDDIRKDFTLHNVIEPLKDKSDFFQWVYSKDTNRNAFLWVNEKVKRKGQSLENSLTKIYRFLLNANAINDIALREALIIADNRQGRPLDVFSSKSRIETIEDLKKQSAYIIKLDALKKEFEDFKLLVNTTESKKKLVTEYLYSFDELLKRELESLKLQIEQTKTQINLYKEEESIIKPKQTELAKEIGSLNTNIGNLQKEKIIPKEEILKEINKILREANPLHTTVETLTDFLETQQNSYQKQFNEVSATLQSITQYNTTQKETENKIKSFTEKQTQLQNKISKFQDLLIHNISENKEVREKLNAFFSQEVIATFTKNDIVHKIQSFENILTINEGKIEGLDKIKPKPLENIVELNEQLETVEKDLKQQKDILDTIKNRTEKEKEKNKFENEIKTIEAKINKISQKDSIENELAQLRNELEKFKKDLTEKEQKHGKISEELTKLDNLIRQEERKKEGAENKIKTYQNEWYPEFEEDIKNLLFQKIEIVETSSIEELRRKLRSEKSKLKGLLSDKQTKFSELQRITENYTANEIDFISQIGQDIFTLKDKEKSIEILLEQVSNDITVPIKTFLDAYKHFKGFITKFNGYISKFNISSYTNLAIIINENGTINKDLEKMANIISVADFKADLFNSLNSSEQKEYLKILESYIERKVKVDFKSLFDISLSAKENNETIKINLNTGEGASTGTYKMIILILFLSVISYFKVEDEENKLIFPIDEDTISDDNLDTLLAFCKEKGFICIFASKKQITGVEKFYIFKDFVRIGTKDKLMVTEIHAKLAQKKKNDDNNGL